MEPHVRRDPAEFTFPPLPIVTPDPPRLSQRQKYGGLFYLGLGGLVVLGLLLAWFAHGLWSTRQVWRAVYVLHDEHRPERERLDAAVTLANDPSVNQRQLWEIAMRTRLPGRARYIVAEKLTAEAASADPRGYALAVARSPGWPDWLRVLAVRPMAYAAARGVAFPKEPLDELRRHPDPFVRLWASAVEAELDPDAPGPRGDLERACADAGPDRELACLLRDAARPVPLPVRQRLLDRATERLRLDHPASARLWGGPLGTGDGS